MRSRNLFLILALCSAVWVSPAAAELLYVSQTGADVHPYGSWIDAATNIQAAVDVAVSGDVVMVESGTYRISQQIMLTNSVTLWGVTNTGPVIIDPDLSNRCVFISDPGVVVANMILTNGTPRNYGDGGGVYSVDGGTLTNCVLACNQAFYGSGALFTNGGIIVSCRVFNNRSWGSGGVDGIGIRYGVIRNCAVTDNGGGEAVGGIEAEYSLVENCLIQRNNGRFWAGGVWAKASTVRNCIISHNSATRSVGGVALSSKSLLEASTVVANYGMEYGGVSGGRTTNCIVYFNRCDEENGSGDDVRYWGTDSNHNFICTSEHVAGVGNITNEPLFMNIDAGDFRLRPDSPCIDAGADLPHVTQDVAGLARPYSLMTDSSGQWDIGAHEYIGAYPAMGMEVRDWTPVFRWSQDVGSLFAVSIEREGTNYLQLFSTNNYWQSDRVFEAGSYSWRFRPADSATNWLYGWSDEFSFSIPDEVPRRPLPVMPNGVSSLSVVEFFWREDDFSMEYYIEITSATGSWSFLSSLVRTTNESLTANQYGRSSAGTSYTTSVDPIAPGPYQWRLRAVNPNGAGEWSESYDLIYDHCKPLSPTGRVSRMYYPSSWGQMMPMHRFAWSPALNADDYELRISRDGVMHTQLVVRAATNWTAEPDLPYGSYDWQVRPAGDSVWSTNAAFVSGITSGRAPTGKVSRAALYADFEWYRVPDATGYNIYIARNGSLYHREMLSSYSGWTVKSWNLWTNFSVGDYQWWVRAQKDGMFGPWSDTMSFVVEPMIPDKLVPMQPVGSISVTNITYSWNADADALWYKIFIKENGVDWRAELFEAEVSPQEVVTGHGYGCTYTWWVRGWGLDGWGPWSDAAAFTCVASGGTDTDGDGATDYDEMTLHGTDPLDPDSVFKIDVKLLGSGHPLLTFTAERGRLYKIERSTNLLGGWDGVWDYTLQLVTTSTVQTFEDSAISNAASYFYRASVR